MAPAREVTPELLAELKAKLTSASDVEAKLAAGGEEGLTDRTLRRWLVARKFQMDKAAKDLTEHAEWRHKHTPNGPLPDSDVAGELGQDKSFLAGVDKHGHPTMVARVKNHKIAKDHQDFYKFMIWILDTSDLCGRVEERKSGKEWDGKVVGILDLNNITLSNCDSSGLFTIFDLLQNHYVERLHKMYLYCAPLIFSGVWAVVSPFVDPVTRAKVQVLPADLGGSGPDRPAAAARQALLEEWSRLSALPRPTLTPLDATAPATEEAEVVGADEPVPVPTPEQLQVTDEQLLAKAEAAAAAGATTGQPTVAA